MNTDLSRAMLAAIIAGVLILLCSWFVFVRYVSASYVSQMEEVSHSQKDVYTRLMLKNCLERESGVK